MVSCKGLKRQKEKLPEKIRGRVGRELRGGEGVERQKNEEETEAAEGSPGERKDNKGKSLLFPLVLSSHTYIPAK